MKIKLITIFLIFMFAMQAKETLIIPKVDVPPIIDGKITETEWNNAVLRDEFYQTAPGDNTLPSEKTEFYMCYYEENLYFLAKCFMEDKSLIRDFRCSRDKIYTTDRVMIFLDTFGSNDRAYYVVANANGEQADGIVLRDIDPTVDFYFESVGNRTDYGWMVEISIPLKSLKYKSGKDVTWGAFLKRVIPERNEEITSFRIKRGGGNYYDNYGLFQYEDIPANQNLTIVPAANSFTENTKINDESWGEEKFSFEPELNVFYEPTSNLTLTATVNPDFNIVEADGLEAEVNLRYPRYFPEKRPFFIEETNPFRSDLFIFNTRRIVNPKWGSKLSGSFGRTSVFAMAAVDEDTEGGRFFEDDEMSVMTDDAKFGFASVSRQYRAGNTKLRLAGTYRGFKEYDNLLTSLDAVHRFNDWWDCDLQAAISYNEVPNGDSTQHNYGAAYSADVDFYTGNLLINVENKAISQDFTADLGFENEVDINLLKNRVEYQIHAETDEDKVRYMEFASTQNIKFDFGITEVMSAYWEGMIGGIFKNNFQYWGGYETYIEKNSGNDEFYQSKFPWLYLQYSPYKFISGSCTFVGGESIFYDTWEVGRYDKYEAGLNLRPNNVIDTEFKYRFQRTRDFYTVNTLEAKIKLQFHKNFWFRTIVQYSHTDMHIYDETYAGFDVHPLFTYKPNTKISLYLGGSTSDDEQTWQETDNTGNQFIEDWKSRGYLIFLKASYAIDII